MITVYQQTLWKFSDVVAPVDASMSEGLHTVKITSASYNDEFAEGSLANTYKVSVECIDDSESAGGRANLTYWMVDNKTGAENKNTISTLCSLGKAIFGEEARGIPAPVDVIGTVCMIDVKLKTNDAGKTYVRVYHFLPASAEFSIYSDKEQYYRKDAPKTSE